MGVILEGHRLGACLAIGFLEVGEGITNVSYTNYLEDTRLESLPEDGWRLWFMRLGGGGGGGGGD